MSLPRGPHVKGSGADDVTGQDGPVTLTLDRPSPVFLANITYRQAADPGPWKTDAPLTPSSSTDNSQCDEKPHLREQSSVADAFPLPDKKGSRVCRYLRWNFGSVYRRIFTLAFVGNLAALAVVGARSLVGIGPPLTHAGAGEAVAANLLVALIIRNEHVVNAIFTIFGSWPRGLARPLRHLFAKVYSYGGVHSGCGVAATMWFVAFLVLLTRDYLGGGAGLSALRGCILLFSYLILGFLVTILVFAHPRVRVTLHNWFECTHRFLGWSAVVSFWAQVLLTTADVAAASRSSYGATLAATPTFWMLLAITLLVIYPWTRLRLRRVEAEHLSDHCIKLNFDYRDAHYGQAIRLSDSPLRETHAFATIPNPPALAPASCSRGARCAAAACTCQPARHPLSHQGEKGFSVVISNAGDWTRKIIRSPPDKIYVRAVPAYGVLRVAGLFEPVIVIATGSGIAPCLSLFVEKANHPVRIIWSAPSPLATFGRGIIEAVRLADPDAVIIDTKASGRPDLVDIAYRLWAGSRVDAQQPRSGLDDDHDDDRDRKRTAPCEAVVIISNQKVTRKVVYGLESRGVPAYGAIFDS